MKCYALISIVGGILNSTYVFSSRVLAEDRLRAWIAEEPSDQLDTERIDDPIAEGKYESRDGDVEFYLEELMIDDGTSSARAADLSKDRATFGDD